MAGTFSFKSLSDGQLANSKGTIYTVPGSTSTVIKLITLVNTNSTAEKVNLYFKANGGTSRRIIPEDMVLNPGYSLIFDDGIFMETGDIIEADAETAAKVDFIVSGVEQS